MFKNQKGITLIALVITIIVLLILAGVTIAMLTGSDSAPVKANEAKQKNDIGTCKDQVYLVASNAQAEAYDKVYVKGEGASATSLQKSAEGKYNDIGNYVGKEVKDNNSLNGKQIGTATITTAAGVSGTSTCTITITTTDYKVTGYIDQRAGTLVWDNDGKIVTNE